jgi:hypothetical protein
VPGCSAVPADREHRPADLGTPRGVVGVGRTDERRFAHRAVDGAFAVTFVDGRIWSSTIRPADG